MKNRTFLIGILVLFTIDQVIKLIMYHYYMGTSHEVIPSLIYIRPVQNIHYSYINSLFSLGMSRGVHIILSLCVAVVWLGIYDYIHTKLRDYRLIHIGIMCGLAGILCYESDILLWGGSIDYVYLQPLYTFDFKDVLLNCSWILIALSLFIYRKETKDVLENKEIEAHFKKRFAGWTSKTGKEEEGSGL